MERQVWLAVTVVFVEWFHRQTFFQRESLESVQINIPLHQEGMHL